MNKRNLTTDLGRVGMTEQEFIAALSHPLACTCQTCWNWWRVMTHNAEYNPPFTKQQIDCDTYKEALDLFGPVKYGRHDGE